MKKVRRFCMPSAVPAAIASSLIFAVGAVVFLFTMISENSNIYIKLFGSAFCIGMFFAARALFKELYLNYAAMFKKRLEYFKQIGVFPMVAPDFEQGVRWFGKNLVVGKNFLFGRENGMIVMYGEIDQLFRNEHRTEYTSGDSPSFDYYLKMVANGKEYTICSLKKQNLNSDEWYQFCNFLSIKNPNAHISQYFQQTQSLVDDSSSGDD